MSKRRLYVGSLAVTFIVASAMWAANQNFLPDATFKGSALTGWLELGEAAWHAKDGEITGTPKRESGGWLVLDRGYQDIVAKLERLGAHITRVGVHPGDVDLSRVVGD